MPDTPKRRASTTGSPTDGRTDPWRPGLVTFSEVRFERSRWWLGALALGLLAIALLESMFLVSDPQPRRWLFALGCLVVVLSGAAAVVAWIRDRGEPVDLTGPETALGWWSLVMPAVAGGWILIVLASGGLEVRLLTVLVVLVGLAVAAGSMTSALVAVLRRGERSLLVIVLGLAPGPLVLFLLLGHLGLAH